MSHCEPAFHPHIWFRMMYHDQGPMLRNVTSPMPAEGSGRLSLLLGRHRCDRTFSCCRRDGRVRFCNHLSISVHAALASVQNFPHSVHYPGSVSVCEEFVDCCSVLFWDTVGPFVEFPGHVLIFFSRARHPQLLTAPSYVFSAAA